MKLLYICSSQFSGSTLTSFLLNSHSAVATIGHTTGWSYAATEDFRCSCGQKIQNCALFVRIARAFRKNGLTFNPQNFGTAFKLSNNSWANRTLLGSLPGIRSSSVESARNNLVAKIPVYRARLVKQEKANLVLMQTVLDFFGASVYLDNSHSPHRFLRLSQSQLFSASPIHLIRDPRGVSLSLMTNSGLDAKSAIGAWIKHQRNIFRIVGSQCSPLVLFYESLCRNTETELRRVFEFAGLSYEPFLGNFKDEEHHILGNRMRLSSGEIRLDERWKSDLKLADRKIVEHALHEFVKRHGDDQLTEVICSYLEITH